MPEPTIAEIDRPDERDAAFAIRHAVFCIEQNVDPAEEFDGRDAQSRLYLACVDGRPAGTARLRQTGAGEAKIERVAVTRTARGRGIGRALMARTIEDARAAGLTRIVIHAQCHAAPFYAALGFRAVGEPFVEAAIPHVRMVLDG